VTPRELIVVNRTQVGFMVGPVRGELSARLLRANGPRAGGGGRLLVESLVSGLVGGPLAGEHVAAVAATVACDGRRLPARAVNLIYTSAVADSDSASAPRTRRAIPGRLQLLAGGSRRRVVVAAAALYRGSRWHFGTARRRCPAHPS